MKKGYALCAFFILALCSTPVHGESLVLYDKFNSPLISPDRWMAEESNSGKIVRESVRQIVSNALNMKIVGYSNNDSNTGAELGTESLIHTNGELVNDFKATVRIKAFSVSACQSNPSGNYARARITAPLFNVGTPVHDSAVDDIYAQFRVLGIPNQPETLKVYALVQRCLDAGCAAVQDLMKKEVRTIVLNEPVTLRIKWNKVNNTITFFHNKPSEPSQSEIFKYTFADDKLAGVAWRKRLDVSIGLGDCTDIPRPSSMIEAVFDNVYVNESAAIGQ